MKEVQGYPYVVKTCKVKFETSDGYETIGYDFTPLGGIGANDIMGLAKKVHKYLAGLCINDLHELDKDGRLASAFVEIDCNTLEFGFDGCPFTVTCDYISLFSNDFIDPRASFKPALYVCGFYVGELFKYADED